MKKFVLTVVAATLPFAASQASAAVVASLPGGTALPIPADELLGVSGPLSPAPGVTFTSTAGSAYGFTGNYSFVSNGVWSGTPMIGLDEGTGYFELTFDTAIAGFLGELNWTTDFGGDASIEIYDSANNLLESLLLETGGVNQVAPGFYGFSRASADISRVRFNEEFIGVRNISTLTDAMGAVPEPATWAFMIFG
ncbi:hypothetical protein, partial [Parasphingorhabdus sp.]